MKKLVAVTLSTLMLCSSVFAGEISVNLNGENIKFDNQAPVIVEGRTLIPLRGVFEKLGYQISWDNATKTATFTKDNTVVKVTVNANSFTLNDASTTLDVPAQIINGSMMLPLRAVGEATGLKVDWDNENKSVNLQSSESKVETTTEATNSNYNAENELEVIKSAAKCVANVYSVLALCDSFNDTESYNMYKIDGGIKYAYSEKEIKMLLDDAIEECEKFKEASADIETGYMDKKIVKNFDNFVDTCVQDYKLIRDYYCSNKYDNLNADEFEAKVEASAKSMTLARNDLFNEMDIVLDKSEEVWSSEKYNVPKSDKANENIKKQREAYLKEIGKVVDEATSFLGDYDKATENYYYYDKAAKTIREKLNSTETPEFCVLNREVMLVCCDLLDKAGKAVGTGAFNNSGKNTSYIKFDYCITTVEVLFKEVLGDTYSLKYIDDSDDNNISDNENEIENNLDGKFV